MAPCSCKHAFSRGLFFPGRPQPSLTFPFAICLLFVSCRVRCFVSSHTHTHTNLPFFKLHGTASIMPAYGPWLPRGHWLFIRCSLQSAINIIRQALSAHLQVISVVGDSKFFNALRSPISRCLSLTFHHHHLYRSKSVHVNSFSLSSTASDPSMLHQPSPNKVSTTV